MEKPLGSFSITTSCWDCWGAISGQVRFLFGQLFVEFSDILGASLTFFLKGK